MATLAELEKELIRAHDDKDARAVALLAREVEQARRVQMSTPSGRRGQREGVVTSEVIDPPRPSPAARLGRGYMDVVDRGQQLWLNATDPEKAKEFTRETDAEIAAYDRGRGPNAGIDLMRAAGATAATMPLTGGLAYGAQALGVGGKLLGRMGVGAAQGAAQGALTYVPEGQSGAAQAGLGAIAGGMAPVLSDAIGYVASKGLQFGRAQARKLAASPESIVAELEPVLEQQGIKWGELSAEVRKGMLDQARRQLTIEGALSPEALARRVEMDDVLGVAGPTRAQVTRNPSEWTWERNTQKAPEIGEPLTARYHAQLQRLQDRAREITGGTGGRAPNDYQAGASAVDAVQRKMKDYGRVVDDLYDVYRESGAGRIQVNASPIADELGKLIEDYGKSNIHPDVKDALREFGMLGGKQTKVLTVDEAEKLRRLIGNNVDPKTPAQQKAMLKLRGAIDEAVLATDDGGIPALQAARSAAASRFAMRDSADSVSAAADGIEPDRFFQKFVLNGKVKDLRGLKTALNTTATGESVPAGFHEPQGAQAWKDLKGRVVEYAAGKASAAGNRDFNGKAFRNALKEIGDERLKVIFDADELAQIRKLDRVAWDLTVEPNLSAVNRSNTAAAGAQYLMDASRAVPALAEVVTKVPFVGKIAAGAWQTGNQVARNAEMRRRVGSALMGDAFSDNPGNQKYSELARLIAGRINPYVTGASGEGAQALFR